MIYKEILSDFKESFENIIDTFNFFSFDIIILQATTEFLFYFYGKEGVKKKTRMIMITPKIQCKQKQRVTAGSCQLSTIVSISL